MTMSKLKHLQKVQHDAAKHYVDLIETRRARASSAQFRHDVLEKQKVYNYTSEYDRLRAHLANSAVPYATRAQVQGRAEKLKQLGARAVDAIF